MKFVPIFCPFFQIMERPVVTTFNIRSHLCSTVYKEAIKQQKICNLMKDSLLSNGLKFKMATALKKEFVASDAYMEQWLFLQVKQLVEAAYNSNFCRANLGKKGKETKGNR